MLIKTTKLEGAIVSSELPTIEEISSIIFKEFQEECRVYIDPIDNHTINIEIHFSDCNYYEQRKYSHENCEDFMKKLIQFIRKELFLDKLYPTVNRNNIRYFNQM